MENILVINAGQSYLESEVRLNQSISDLTVAYFEKETNFAVQRTDVEKGYSILEEIQKISWADIIIYHTPVWWFSVPNSFKKYLDDVITKGKGKFYGSDGRSSKLNPKLNYGRSGLLSDKKYILTTTWNAPLEAFELEEEFFKGRSVDDGVMYGFHKMNEYIGMKNLFTYHFYDVNKNPRIEIDFLNYEELLNEQVLLNIDAHLLAF
ncbi:NAD(P)H-dependent oxidoreductase [Flammeovirga kamogawensis]|uniref:NAD(P)H-dependent oxidoreductase n=1 Tax=Flammeovirga kamogawensis TaxID=373891 RepID=A0ABX8GRT7_9BACT|nr:NAD(P)H-dependent oxidoreductase [Flammeovirga kamogawensis]MBB6461399.1 modulator of drug activity B [Flammeovirga kamogawensis]QWG06298.1 NAD(P)H-dependent oxidoreductase [Flammeovirga kamogawensis]TRX68127.1 NAD(P)H-dependent oxidoreductase [Flammeovirga kamogawensis]